MREIGDPPGVEDRARRAEAEASLRRFCEVYMPGTFRLKWSADHLMAIRSIESVVTDGGTMAFAMPRGSGKTSLALAAVLWAMLSDRVRFVLFVGADKDAATGLLGDIKTELGHNDMLLADWPAMCHPIRCLEGEPRRCIGQMMRGHRTEITWRSDRLSLPWVPGEAGSGAIVRVAGITGQIRGAKHARPDGSVVRPNLVIVDDPQTDASARSISQCMQRQEVLTKAIMGLAGPGQHISVIMPCTVIRRGDLADVMLDRQMHPEWRGIRTKLMRSMPKNMDVWDQWWSEACEGLREEDGGARDRAFYEANREKLEDGADPAWPERMDRSDCSATHHAMRLYYTRGAASFASEYQNDPVDILDLDAAERLTPVMVAGKLNSLSHRQCPRAASLITAGIDVQEHALYYVVTAWESDTTGYVIDYGVYPDQGRQVYSYRDVTRKLSMVHRSDPLGPIAAGIMELGRRLLDHRWKMDGGGDMQVSRLLVDARYRPRVVAGAVSKLGSAAMCARGEGITETKQPISQYKRRPGEMIGEEWYIPRVKGSRDIHAVHGDVNHWKTRVHDQLLLAPGERGSLSLWGDKPFTHAQFAEHVAGTEFWELKSGRGRTVKVWKEKVAKPDNHWLDCLVMSAIAASMLGIRQPTDQSPGFRRTVSLADRAKQRKVWRPSHAASA